MFVLIHHLIHLFGFILNGLLLMQKFAFHGLILERMIPDNHIFFSRLNYSYTQVAI